MAFADPFDRRLDCVRDTLTCALGGRTGAPVAPAQPDGAGKLRGQSVNLKFNLRGAFEMVEFLGLVEFLAQLSQPAPVVGASLVIEHLAGVAQVAEMDPGALQLLRAVRQGVRGASRSVRRGNPARALDQIKHMEIPPRRAPQPTT